MLKAKDFLIPTLGEAKIASPLTEAAFIDDSERVLYRTDVAEVLREAAHPEELLSFEKAGARKRLFHDPACSRAAILTAGGLCPG